MTPDEFYEQALSAADDEGRLPLARMSGWEIFPFEEGSLRVVRLEPPHVPEAPRSGLAGVGCGGCGAGKSPVVWTDDHWQLKALPASGAPLVLMLQPLQHHDLPGLPDDLAAEMGRLVVHLARAVEGLPHVARCHVNRWGDGGEHLHLFFFARPEGFAQLRGSCFVLWDDLLPPVPADVHAADVSAVARVLAASYGGTAHV